tara:strand:- start:340 stop:603 length:264 start_codon:yes stop_codon:yes gene_type:complete
MRDTIEKYAEEWGETIILFEPRELDDALIGIAARIGLRVAAYDYAKLVEIHHKKLGMNLEEAEEWVQINAMGSYMGDGTPVIVWIPQ